MLIRNSSYLLLFLLLVQCKDLFLNENTKAEVSAVIEGNELVIKNGLHFDLYCFAVDQETSYVIDWEPVESDENRIGANKTRVFSTDYIYSYDPEKAVIVFIWNNDHNYWTGIEINL